MIKNKFNEITNVDETNPDKNQLSEKKTTSGKELSQKSLPSQEEIIAISEFHKKENLTLRKRIELLEKQIANIEKSTLWKIKRTYDKIKYVFRSSTSSPSGNGILKRLKFFISRHFFRVFRKFFKQLFKYLYLLLEDKPVRIILLEDLHLLTNHLQTDPYQIWLDKNSPRTSDLEDYKKNIPLLPHKPFFSIIVPVYNPQISYLRAMLDSITDQIYPYYEVCIADDASPNEEIRTVIKEYAEKDSRFKYIFRNENGHISACSNSALSLATGEFAVLVDHDDLITIDALYQVAYNINQNPTADFIYSDEDKINDSNQLHGVHFKPDWSPDNFLSRNYVCHLAVLRMSILKEIEGFRIGFEGSQDYDLFLRFFEKSTNIVHIPKVLYHWRTHSQSTAMSTEAKPYAYIAAQKALTEALVRRNEPGQVMHGNTLGTYIIRYEIKDNPKVSIIIPNKNKPKLLSACLNSIFKKSTYKNFEIIIVDNGSTDPEVFSLYQKMSANFPTQFQHHTLNIPFNFSSLINYGRSKATGDFLLLLNNDTEVITEDWMEAMIEYAQRKTTGVVGCKLLYANDTIQHAGVVVGICGTAGHTFVTDYKDDTKCFNYINSINNYSALTGACIMVKASLFDSLNGLDEKFCVEFNDIDFCLRVKELGFHNVYLPHVELYHYESLSRGNIFSSKKATQTHDKEQKLFIEKWKSYIKHDPCYSPNLSLNATDFRIKL